MTSKHTIPVWLAAVLFGTAVLTTPVEGVHADQAQQGKQSKKVEQKTRQETAQDRKAIIKEAVSAIRFTRDALAALDEGNKATALKELEKASGKLDVVLARNPKLALAPVDVRARTYDIHGTVEDVRQARQRAEELMDEGKIQQARSVLETLASETVIETTNIPLQTYPDAIRSTVALIDEGKMKEARRLLQSTLNTLVVTERVIPLPLSATRLMLDEAQKLAEKQDRSEKENKRLKNLLQSIRKEIKFAQALGYGKEKDFETFYEELDTIEDKTKAGGSETGLFGEISDALDNMFAHSQATASNKARRNTGKDG
jgi:hypothetical protein